MAERWITERPTSKKANRKLNLAFYVAIKCALESILFYRIHLGEPKGMALVIMGQLFFNLYEIEICCRGQFRAIDKYYS